MVARILLAILGAVLAILAKIAVDAYGMRELRPELLNQIRQTASLCKSAFSPGEAKAAGTLCDVARIDLTARVRFGARPRKTWRAGVKLLSETSIQIGVATSTDGLLSDRALEKLRTKGAELEEWLAEVEK